MASPAKVRKLFGYTYQYRSKYRPDTWKERTHFVWYRTERQRDDAMRAAAGGFRTVYEIRNVMPIHQGKGARP